MISVGKSNESHSFQRKSFTDLPVEIDFYPDSMKNDLRDILLKDSIVVIIDLTGKFTFLGIRTHKVMPTLLKTDNLVNSLVTQSLGGDGFKTRSIKLVKGSIKETTFNVAFDFKNSLNLPLELKNMQYEIFADEAKQIRVANLNFDINKHLAQNSTELIQSDVVVDNLSSAISGIKKVFKGKLDYYLEGYALISLEGREIKIPVKQHFLVDPLTQKNTILKDYE